MLLSTSNKHSETIGDLNYKNRQYQLNLDKLEQINKDLVENHNYDINMIKNKYV